MPRTWNQNDYCPQSWRLQEDRKWFSGACLIISTWNKKQQFKKKDHPGTGKRKIFTSCDSGLRGHVHHLKEPWGTPFALYDQAQQEQQTWSERERRTPLLSARSWGISPLSLCLWRYKPTDSPGRCRPRSQPGPACHPNLQRGTRSLQEWDQPHETVLACPHTTVNEECWLGQKQGSEGWIMYQFCKRPLDIATWVHHRPSGDLNLTILNINDHLMSSPHPWPVVITITCKRVGGITRRGGGGVSVGQAGDVHEWRTEKSTSSSEISVYSYVW